MEPTAIDAVQTGAVGFITVISRVIYRGGRRSWRVTFFEAVLVALACATVGPVFNWLGMPLNLAYPFSVFAGYVGIDRLALIAQGEIDKRGGK